ncbi:MAG: phosphotyrosine protein phosphatase [Acidobacteria bacterium SCN 69-37]|nr:MAG: phosphotyrosine protein phosphatase [Acidobacteria bacterium SCN 69-37]
MPTRVLFVCLGNICRSPAAEGVFRHLVEDTGLREAFVVDSAGTGAWHAGEPPDRRMQAAAAQRGLRLSSIARQVVPSDFEDFDWILAMDASNLQHLRRLAHPSHHHKIRKFRDFDPDAPGADVPDPYYGDADGFTTVLDIVTRTAQALLAHLRAAARPDRAHVTP